MLLFCAKRNLGMQPWERLAHQLYRWKNVQCLVCLLNIITAAFLAGYIGSHDLDQGTLPAFVVVAGATFVFTGLSSWFGRHLDGFERRTCMWLFLTFDITCMGTQIAAIVLLSAAKLPWDCRGIAHAPDNFRDPKAGFDTPAFGDDDSKGELDHFCPIPRMNWVLSLLLLISYIHTMGWSIRLIAALHRRAKQAKVDVEAQRQAKLAESPVAQPARLADPAPPLPRSHVVVSTSLALPEPPRQSVFDTDSALISNGSWSTPGPTPAASPPAYEEEEDGTKKAPPREK